MRYIRSAVRIAQCYSSDTNFLSSSGRVKSIFSVCHNSFSSSTSRPSVMQRWGQEVSTSSLLRKHMVKEARDIFQRSVTAVLPRQMIQNKLKYDQQTNILLLEGTEYELGHNVYVVGFGKAVLAMARAVEDLLGHHIVEGVLSVPLGTTTTLQQDMQLLPTSKLQVIEGAEQNLPDERAYKAALKIKDMATKVNSGDVLIVLISGGGSALLPAPEPPVTLKEMQLVTRLMSEAGATIKDLNTARKQIEILKGGGLAEIAWPAKTISLILSDVIGDPLDFIASGPTVPDSTTPEDVLKLFSNLNIMTSVPQSVLDLIRKKVEHRKNPIGETCPKSQIWSHVQNVLVGSNKLACEAACNLSVAMGFQPLILTTEMRGEAREVGQMFAQLARTITLNLTADSYQNGESSLNEPLLHSCGLTREAIDKICETIKMARASSKLGVCIIAGGETTVHVRGRGRGGRNQEMVVSFATGMESFELSAHLEVVFLSAGTDGQDGPTPAAGAVVTSDFLLSAQKSSLDVNDYLDRNDTFTLLSLVHNGSFLVSTGLTGTNVMDIQLLLVKSDFIAGSSLCQ